MSYSLLWIFVLKVFDNGGYELFICFFVCGCYGVVIGDDEVVVFWF